MDHINPANVVSSATLKSLEHLRSDLGKLNSYITILENRIDHWYEISSNTSALDVKMIIIELEQCRRAQGQMKMSIAGLEHEINIEIIRGIHLICA